MHTRSRVSRVSCVVAAGLAALVLAAQPATAAFAAPAPPAVALPADHAADAVAAEAMVLSGVVIDEFTPAGLWGSTDEYVDLRNTSLTEVSIADWTLSICYPPHAHPISAVTFSSSASLEPLERMLLAGGGFPGSADWFYSSDVPEDGGWVLTDDSGDYVDGVGLTENGCVETDPPLQCPWTSGISVARDPAGTDTDNNLTDFTCGARTPGY